MSRKVVLTGFGCVSGLGIGIAETWRNVAQGKGAIRPLRREPPPEHPNRRIDGPAAWVDAEACRAALGAADLRPMGQLDPLSLHALTAGLEAVETAGLRSHASLAHRTAILVGCGSGGNATVDLAFERLYARDMARVHPQTIPASMISAPASHLAMLLGCHGPTFVISSACASSAHALGEAMHMIRSGRVEVALAGGSEACLTLGSWVAWNSVGVMADDTCRPFSRDRKGMVLGEGAAMVVLESEEHARTRGAKILGELAGYGSSSDAAEMTAPDLRGIEAAIRMAHEDAGIAPNESALISTHGTGTRLNDVVEAAALKAVYGSALRDHTVIATKSAHGHLIGATAAMEFVIGMEALARGVAPPVLNHLGPDPECDLPLALQPRPIDHRVLVSNSFAFGGLNAVLVGRIAS
ncbi:beta-ketoacyl-[acyl-carrier-protein] synthase family protein [Novosphingobium sp.]|uniref:beta-ketoacyl-[acyl-carrier-protein] synthase family protein n=1 Tax=Novosphingobium sp. TaxID=1874826 RepID=UPI0028B1AE8D|nr:beta-ketoacyl-[acyl-carrier-protein] synthase family protein [Novosphingobium sp.]